MRIVQLSRRSIGALTCLLAVGGVAHAEAAPMWSAVSEADIVSVGRRTVAPTSATTWSADVVDIRDALRGAPLEGLGAWDEAVTLSLPTARGEFERYRVIESPIMAAELAAKYPDIRTYAARGIDTPTATGRLDVGPAGFHAMILSDRGTEVIDPYQLDDTSTYIAYEKADLRRAPGSWTCGFEATNEELRGVEASLERASRIENGQDLRTYRVAIATTGEYTVFHGGTVASGLAAVVTALNRVNGIYEREVSVRMELIANNDLLIYTNGATDPYTNNNGSVMLGENQANIDAVIGSANYDIGHVFSTGGGGIAGLGVVCTPGLKARGVTGLPSPTGDTFYVDYVAHEMGHQYNGPHSFNGTAGACGGNRSATGAYEPGSGSTIMGYAGICGSHNIQNFSDDYFSSRSQDIIITFSRNAATCAVVTPTGNTPPVAVADQAFNDLPIDTPFTLAGSGTDDDGDPLTYCWEEFDLGPAGHPDFPTGNAPIFRSFLPVSEPVRTFPQWSDIIDNDQTIGEILPSYGRNLRFRLIVRDNLGGTNHDQISFGVDDTAGPFLVTAPNGGETLSSIVDHTVTWDVAGTDNATVNCQIVDIRLSTDGGLTYPTTLVAGTANDGSELVTLPDINTTTARIQVAAADHVFFDISNENFEITTTVAVGDAASVTGPHLLANRPNPATPRTTIEFSLDAAADVTLRVFDSSGRSVATLADAAFAAGRHDVAWSGRDAGGRVVAPGVYYVHLDVGGARSLRKIVVAR